VNADLSTTYLGLALPTPLVIAACPIGQNTDWLKRLEENGASAVVLPSLFEEQIEYEDYELSAARDHGAEYYAEHSEWFPEPAEYRAGPQEYLELIERSKNSLSMPVIASLNGVSEGGWVKYAKRMEDAGADALELNVYYIATDLDATALDVEKQHLDLVAAVKQSISIPLAVKVGPYFSAMGNMAKRLVEAGADGLVLFNRFIQPDIDLEQLDLSAHVQLSTPYELLAPLRWTAILRGRIGDASLAVTSGIHDADGMLKALLVGADVGMVASAIYRHGFDRASAILSGLKQLMIEKEYDSIAQLKGSMSRENCPNPEAFARGNYMKALTSFTGAPI
jgi:dihydroorotate dehydrogenase (fumarate)